MSESRSNYDLLRHEKKKKKLLSKQDPNLADSMMKIQQKLDNIESS